MTTCAGSPRSAGLLWLRRALAKVAKAITEPKLARLLIKPLRTEASAISKRGSKVPCFALFPPSQTSTTDGKSGQQFLTPCSSRRPDIISGIKTSYYVHLFQLDPSVTRGRNAAARRQALEERLPSWNNQEVVLAAVNALGHLDSFGSRKEPQEVLFLTGMFISVRSWLVDRDSDPCTEIRLPARQQKVLQAGKL